MTSTICRSTDPITSLYAAADEGNRRPAMLDVLLAAYAEAGVDGLTSQEAAEWACLLHTGYWKRVSDLQNLQFIAVRPGVLRLNSSGRKGQVWEITLDGRLYLKQAMAALRAK